MPEKCRKCKYNKGVLCGVRGTFAIEDALENRQRELKRLHDIDAIETLNYLIEECGW